MANFVHLTPEKNAKAMRRGGIRCRRSTVPARRVVFAMPVTRNFYVSHQWLRELRRSGQRTFVAVHFRIPDDQPVLVGHYGAEHASVTAAEATSLVMAAPNAEGWEVLIPRKIEPAEIRAIRKLRQVTGWRYMPGSHGRRPCGCDYCQRGQIKSRRVRERYESE